MIAILSPAKTLDFDRDYQLNEYTIPDFMPESECLIEELKAYKPKELSNLMSISPSLSDLNFQRYQAWDTHFDLSNSKQSILCFKGGVYVGLNVDSFSKSDLTYAQNYLRILSGLHGVLRPFDLIKPYRLEMGTKLKNKSGKNLYDFWGDKITNSINNNLQESSSEFLLNLASNEYFSCLNSEKISRSIVDVKFLDEKNGVYKIISFFAKKARGAMAAFLIKNKIKKINDLKDFTDLGYTFNKERSDKNTLVFIR